MVDCWCLLGADAALLESTASGAAALKPGLYARIDGEIPHWPKLYAVLSKPLKRAAVEDVMQKFVELGFPDTLLRRLRPGDPHVRLT